MGHYDRKLFLPNYDLHLFHGVGKPILDLTIYQVFDDGGDYTVVLRTKEDMEFCEALALMYGRKLNCMYLWDWHDKVYDAMYERPQTKRLEDFFYGMVSDWHDMVGMVDKPQRIEKMRREEADRQQHLSYPQPWIDPKEMFRI